MFSYLSRRIILVLLILGLFVLASVPFQIKIDKNRDKFRSIHKTLNLDSSTLSKVSLGYKELLADIYWLRMLQYFGSDDIKLSQKDSKLLYNYFDIITDLDPKFVNAYRFGGSFLAEPSPIGLGELELGAKLMDKGRENNPENFRIPLEEAFIYYLHYKDYKKASELFNEASEKPALSDTRRASIKGLAASALNRGGEREMSKQIWTYIYNTAQNPNRKEFALKNLNEIATKDKEDELTDIARNYEQKYGVFPDSLNILVDSRFLDQIPYDHEGNKFILAPKMKKVKSVTLLKIFFKEHIGFLNARAQKFKRTYGRNPKDIDELKLYVQETSLLREFQDHPLGDEYKYDPETGTVSFDKSIFE